MNWIVLVMLAIISISILLFLIASILIRGGDHSEAPDVIEYPQVSILIAVRNEEHNIVQLLKNLNNLEYPQEKLEIIIGDDGSTDRTLELINEHKWEAIKIVSIQESDIGLRAKMNVLDQLTSHCKGEYLLFTDADMNLPGMWVQEMLKSTGSDVGVVGGFTRVSGNSVFSKIQDIDYGIAQGLIKLANDLLSPIAVSGNNMLLNKSYFEQVDGFRNMEFSLVEDIAIMRKLRDAGFKIVLKHSKNSTAYTLPANSITEYIHQRLRWIENFKGIPFWIQMVLLINVASIVALVGLAYYIPLLAMFLFAVKIGLVCLFVRNVYSIIEEKINPIHVVLHELFQPFLYISIFTLAVVGKSINWKGRKY